MSQPSTHDIIIDAARELFTKYGYTKVSMDEIAREANVTKKTVYSHFQDKASLFQYFIDEELGNIKREVESREDASLPLIDKVNAMLVCALNYRKRSQLLGAVANEKDAHYCRLALEKYDNEIMRYIQEKLEAEMRLGNIKRCDSQLMAFVIYKLYVALLFEYTGDLDEAQITKETTLVLKEGLLN